MSEDRCPLNGHKRDGGIGSRARTAELRGFPPHHIAGSLGHVHRMDTEPLALQENGPSDHKSVE